MNGLLSILLLVSICSIQGGKVRENNGSCKELGGKCVSSISNCQKIIRKAKCPSGSKCCATPARVGRKRGKKLGKEKTTNEIKTPKRHKGRKVGRKTKKVNNGKGKKLGKEKTKNEIKTPKERNIGRKSKKINNGRGRKMKQRKNGEKGSQKRVCKKTPKKCKRKGGTCTHYKDECQVFIGEGLCKGHSCDCCASLVVCEAKKRCNTKGGTCKDSCESDEDEIPKGCKGKGCKCCGPSDPGPVICKRKSPCRNKGGTCKDSCESDEDEIPRGCKGKGCKCCVPSVTCKIKSPCRNKGGSCVTDPDDCDGDLFIKGCKGDGCLCCVPVDPVEPTTTKKPATTAKKTTQAPPTTTKKTPATTPKPVTATGATVPPTTPKEPEATTKDPTATTIKEAETTTKVPADTTIKETTNAETTPEPPIVTSPPTTIKDPATTTKDSVITTQPTTIKDTVTTKVTSPPTTIKDPATTTKDSVITPKPTTIKETVTTKGAVTTPKPTDVTPTPTTIKDPATTTKDSVITPKPTTIKETVTTKGSVTTPKPTDAPTTTTEATTTSSSSARTIQCGIETTAITRIVGGVDVSPIRKYSWQAALFQEGFFYYCGGSIITDKHILTAAHCFYDFPPTVTACAKNVPSQFFVGIGDHNQVITTDNLPDFLQPVLASQVFIHESYDCARFSNDIAVIELSKSLDLLKNAAVLHPVCLPKDASKTYEGVTATVSGWGSTVGYGPTDNPQPDAILSNILQEVQLPVLSNTDCSTLAGADITQQLCAAVTEGGKDACQGDSGGPLTVKENGQYAQIGVVSYGDGCASQGNPGVYARVTNYLDWIKGKVGSETTYSLP